MTLGYLGVTLKTVYLPSTSWPWTVWCLTDRGLSNPCLKPSANCNHETHLSDVCLLTHPGTSLKSSLHQNTFCPLKLLTANVPCHSHSCLLFIWVKTKRPRVSPLFLESGFLIDWNRRLSSLAVEAKGMSTSLSLGIGVSVEGSGYAHSTLRISWLLPSRQMLLARSGHIRGLL